MSDRCLTYILRTLSNKKPRNPKARRNIATGIALWALVLHSPFAAAAERVAFVIGNSDYEDVSSLSNPKNDAIDVGQRLKALGFELHENKVHTNLGERALLSKFNQFTRIAKNADIAFLYFAGHGMQFDGAPHLLPIDIPNDELNIVQSDAISLDLLLDQLNGKARLTIAVFDACREIPDYRKQVQRATRGGGDTAWRGLSRPTVKMNSSLIAYSGGSGELVADGVGRNSPYTSLLLEYLDREIETSSRLDVPSFFSEISYQFRQRNKGQSPEVINQGVKPNRYFLAAPPAAKPVPEKQSSQGKLTIKVEPTTASVRIMNIAPVYRDGIELELQREYDILVSSEGYQTWRKTITLSKSELTLGVVLKRLDAVFFERNTEPQRNTPQASANSTFELEWWNLAKEGASEDSYQNYLTRYPDGEFSTIANSRIANIKNSQTTVATSPPTDRPVESINPQPDWGLALRTGTINALTLYLSQCAGSCDSQSNASTRLLDIKKHQNEFRNHIRNNELTSGTTGTAVESIRSVESLVPNDPWLGQARTEVANRYAVLAQSQKRAGRLNAANELVVRGLSVASTKTLLNIRQELDSAPPVEQQPTRVNTQKQGNIVSIQEDTITSERTSPQITLPSDNVTSSGIAIKVLAHVASTTKIDDVKLYWSTSSSFSSMNTARMYFKSTKSDGQLVYTGRFTPPKSAKNIYYFLTAVDQNDQNGSLGSIASPFSYKLPARVDTATKSAPTIASIAKTIDYGKDCAIGNLFTKTSTYTQITETSRLKRSSDKYIPYGSVSKVELSNGVKEYFIYTKWKNLKEKKYDFTRQLFDSTNSTVGSRQSNGFENTNKGTTWTTWYSWKPSSSAPPGEYTHVTCEGGKRHVFKFQVVK